MAFRMHKVQVWSAEIPDRPGAAAAKLAILARAGANLEIIFTRAVPGKEDVTMLFLAPITTSEQTEAARMAGLAPARDMMLLCVEGDNRPGIGSDIMSRLAVAGVNLRGLSCSAPADRFAAYLAFDDADTVATAIQVLANIVA